MLNYGEETVEKKEIDRIYEWSVQAIGKYCYPKKDVDSVSCFTLHDGDVYMEEYGFDTIADLKRKLGDMWSADSYMENIIKCVSVAAMKNRPADLEIKDNKEELNEFIYIF